MSEFKQIVDYFKFNRRGEKANKQTDYLPILYLNESYNNAIETDITSILKIYINSPFCKKISHEIEGYKFYFRKAIAGHYVYYIKENVLVNPKYRRIPLYLNSDWEILPINEASQLKEIKETNSFNRYFDQQNDIIFEIQLEDVEVFKDEFLYHPNDIKVPEGEYSFDYLDHEGYDNSTGDWALRFLTESALELYENNKYRKVEFFKNLKSGYVNLFPRVKINLLGDYVVRYTYYEKGIKHNSSMSERAVKLRFNYFGAFLEYFNQTIFYFLDKAEYFDKPNRKLFLNDYMNIVSDLLRSARGEEVLKVLYYVPIGLFERIDAMFLWDILDQTLRGNVTNVGTNKEDIVLRILDGLAKSMKNNDAFLNELLKSTNNKETRFKLLYDKLNSDNFKTFVSFIHKIWFQSNFMKPENKGVRQNSLCG